MTWCAVQWSRFQGLCVVVWLVCLAARAQAVVLELTQAQATVTVNGQTMQQMVSLPYHWDRRHPARYA